MKTFFESAGEFIPPMYPFRSLGHPGLFAPIANILLCREALTGYSARFPGLDPLPPFPRYENNMVIDVLLQGVYDVGCDLIPNDFILLGTQLDGLEKDMHNGLLTGWIKDCLDTLTTTNGFDKCDVHPDDLIRMVRSLWTVYNDTPDCFLATELFRSMTITFTCLAIHRYSCVVLLPLVHALEKELGKGRTHLRPLAELMVEVVEKWIGYCAEHVPNAIKVSFY
jgi:hypothetical protein